MYCKVFTFNPFFENTYVIYDDTRECIVVDPGCCDVVEQEQLAAFIEKENLKPVRLLNTHCHVDHVLGNKFIFEKYQLLPEIHPDELPLLQSLSDQSRMFGLTNVEPSPTPKVFLEPNQIIRFGRSQLKVLYTPGHSPGEVSFYNMASRQLLAGDVIFQGSIGRTDLPGGSYELLMNSIHKQILILEDDVIIYPGHGPQTTIGREKEFNPFLQVN